MIDYKTLVKNFHAGIFYKTGDWRISSNQKFLKGNPAVNRISDLIQEECMELLHELYFGTKETVRKELCDLLYVTFAVAAIYDLPVEDDFLEVHANNMLKLETGFIGPNGKFMKAKDHPKVEFKSAEYPQLDLPINYTEEEIASVSP